MTTTTKDFERWATELNRPEVTTFDRAAQVVGFVILAVATTVAVMIVFFGFALPGTALYEREVPVGPSVPASPDSEREVRV